MNAFKFDAIIKVHHTFEKTGLNPFQCLAKITNKCKAGREPVYAMSCNRPDGVEGHVLIWDGNTKQYSKGSKWRKDEREALRIKREKQAELEGLRQKISQQNTCREFNDKKKAEKGKCGQVGGNCQDVWTCDGDSDVSVGGKCPGDWYNQCCFRDVC
jgi:hypothetical protein